MGLVGIAVYSYNLMNMQNFQLTTFFWSVKGQVKDK